jgi:GYF domain 2
VADQWYYARGEDKLGPFSARLFKDLANAGGILPTDTVWKEGIEKGVPAARGQEPPSARSGPLLSRGPEPTQAPTASIAATDRGAERGSLR